MWVWLWGIKEADQLSLFSECSPQNEQNVSKSQIPYSMIHALISIHSLMPFDQQYYRACCTSSSWTHHLFLRLALHWLSAVALHSLTEWDWGRRSWFESSSDTVHLTTCMQISFLTFSLRLASSCPIEELHSLGKANKSNGIQFPAII